MRRKQLTLNANPQECPNDRDAIVGECHSEGHATTEVVQLSENDIPKGRPKGAVEPSPGQVTEGNGALGGMAYWITP